MTETGYINKDGICNRSHINRDDGSSLLIESNSNIPQQCPLRPGDSVTIIPTNNTQSSYKICIS